MKQYDTLTIMTMKLVVSITILSCSRPLRASLDTRPSFILTHTLTQTHSMQLIRSPPYWFTFHAALIWRDAIRFFRWYRFPAKFSVRCGIIDAPEHKSVCTGQLLTISLPIESWNKANLFVFGIHFEFIASICINLRAWFGHQCSDKMRPNKEKKTVRRS